MNLRVMLRNWLLKPSRAEKFAADAETRKFQRGKLREVAAGLDLKYAELATCSEYFSVRERIAPISTWTQKVNELNAGGMTYAEIGVAIGLATSTVGDLAAGRYKSPRGDAAMALAKLHDDRCTARNAAALQAAG